MDPGRALGAVSEVVRGYSDRIELATLFGSLVRGVWTHMSDVDVGVLPRGDWRDLLPGLAADLAAALGLPEERVDVVIVSRDLPPALLYEAVVRGVLVHCRDPRVYEEWVLRALKLHSDVVHMGWAIDEYVDALVRMGLVKLLELIDRSISTLDGKVDEVGLDALVEDYFYLNSVLHPLQVSVQQFRFSFYLNINYSCLLILHYLLRAKFQQSIYPSSAANHKLIFKNLWVHYCPDLYSNRWHSSYFKTCYLFNFFRRCKPNFTKNFHKFVRIDF